VARNYEAIRSDISRHRIDLTDTQIRQVAKLLPSHIKRLLGEGTFDTMEREYFLDALVEFVLGPDDHWPLNCEAQYSETFKPRFVRALEAKGIAHRYIWEKAK